MQKNIQVKSKYLERFKNSKLKPQGAFIFVEKIDLEFKTKGGIFLGDHTSKQFGTIKQEVPFFAIVLATGKGYTDGTPMDVAPGNVILLSSESVKLYSFINGLNDYKAQEIGISTDSSSQMIFETIEDFENWFEDLNKENK